MGRLQPEARAQFAWEVLNAQAQRLLKEGNAIKTPEENLAELLEQAKQFSIKSSPILQALGIP